MNQASASPKFAETWCSNCGRKFGPGDHGYSHCDQHGSPRLDPTKFGVRVSCTVCGHTKQPLGRSAPAMAYHCNSECNGYYLDPQVGSLWPDESEVDFGFWVGDLGVQYKEQR